MSMRKIYKRIAREHGITPEEVEREMKEAIGAAYAQPSVHAQCIPRKGELPTPEEFIKYAGKRAVTKGKADAEVKAKENAAIKAESKNKTA